MNIPRQISKYQLRHTIWHTTNCSMDNFVKFLPGLIQHRTQPEKEQYLKLQACSSTHMLQKMQTLSQVDTSTLTNHEMIIYRQLCIQGEYKKVTIP